MQIYYFIFNENNIKLTFNYQKHLCIEKTIFVGILDFGLPPNNKVHTFLSRSIFFNPF